MPRLSLLLAYLLVFILAAATANAQPGLAGSVPQKQLQYLSGRDNTRTAT